VKTVLRIQVVNGPDVGKGGIFMQGPVRVGRGHDNDVVLSDPRVSSQHFEVGISGNTLVLTDKRSLHGLIVDDGNELVELKDSQAVSQRAFSGPLRIEVGRTTLMLEFDDSTTRPVRRPLASPPTPDPFSFLPNPNEFGERERSSARVVRDPSHSGEAVRSRFGHDDARLASLFSLSKELNAVRDLERVLELVVQATFEAFPTANFFVISIPEETIQQTADVRLRPLHAQRRGEKSLHQREATISQSLLKQVFEERQSMCFLSGDAGQTPSDSMMIANINACMVAPLLGQTGTLGVIEADTRSAGGIFDEEDLEVFNVIASLTAFAMERVRLTDNIYDMFEGVVRLSVTAIDARDPSTAGHSERVADYAVRLAIAINDCSKGPYAAANFSRDELIELRYAALLHDFGKVGVSEAVLTKPTRLPPEMLNGLRERLESARLSIRHQSLLQAHRLAGPNEWESERILAHAEELASGTIRLLDDAERLLIEFQPGKQLTDEARSGFEHLARLSFVDSRGRSRALLTSKELEFLLIPRGTLTRLEWEEMRSHALKSRTYLSTIPWSRELARIPEFAGAHHEKLDGSGYPFGLTAESIPTQARILAICDIFDAMTAIDRAYRKASSVSTVVNTLIRESQMGMLDADLVEIFVRSVVPFVAQDYSLPD
jgi:HD-GYP domain-containing protein (c-di-GMP phosphodiesterase class II)